MQRIDEFSEALFRMSIGMFGAMLFALLVLKCAPTADTSQPTPSESR